MAKSTSSQTATGETQAVVVKMLTSMVGGNFSYAPGDLVEVPGDIATAWVEAGLASLATTTAVKHIGKPSADETTATVEPSADGVETAEG